MTFDLNHQAIYISGSIIALACIIAPLLFKKELKFVSKKYYLVAYYISVIVFFLTSTNPHEPASAHTELFKSIASVNSIFLSFILTAFICHREKEVGLFYALIALTLAKILSIYFHADTAYVAVSFSLAYNVLGLIAIVKNIKNKADIGLAMCFATFTFLLSYTLVKAPLDISNVEFYDKYYLNLLVFIPGFICGSTIFIFLRYTLDLNNELRQLAYKDPLTGLSNRRFAFELMSKQIEYIERKNTPACVIMTDIDHFKQINDTHGHQVGDEVIKAFANIILDEVRKYDVACRYGGEEFLLFLPDTKLEQAVTIAERLRTLLEAKVIDQTPEKIYVSASFGVAAHHKSQAIEQAIKRADSALYRSKQNGRNQVQVQMQELN